MKTLQVYELNEYVRKSLERDALLSAVAVCGEISGYKRHSSGHIYFTLKDDRAAIACSFFKQHNYKLGFEPKEGMKVVAMGAPSIYVQQGKYQLIVTGLEEVGGGDLLRKLQELKASLEAEGLFAPERKRAIPFLPKKIGVVTSPTGAVFSDILRVTAQRNPQVDVVLSPVLVQGAEAAPDIVCGLRMLEKTDIDVIILGRGGGSVEDLWCFNDERVVRAVAACTVPLISAVGHEIDYTLCDFAADVRAATPSHAAQLAVPDLLALRDALETRRVEAARRLTQKLADSRATLERLQNSYVLREPAALLKSQQRELAYIADRALQAAETVLEAKKNQLAGVFARAEALSPLSVLARGYAVVSNGGTVITEANRLREGDEISILFKKGSAKAVVQEVHNEK